MSDIRKFFKKVPTPNQKRPRDDDDALVPKTTTKPIPKVVEIPKEIVNKSPPKRLKTIDIDPDERKKRSENFKAFMNRGGPSAPGSKTIPDGQKNCLKNRTFVISGVLDSLERDECKALIEKYGGRVTITISGKTNYLIIGRDASEGKKTKAKELKLKTISEDDLLEMIRTFPGEDETPSSSSSTTTKESTSSTLKRKTSTSTSTTKESTSSTLKRKASTATTTKKQKEPEPIPISINNDPSLLWVDKYKPKTIKHLIGQQSENSCVQKLLIWLRDWYKYHGQSDEVVKAKSSFGYNRNENPALFKAALLSGPPGIGKTTAAQLVCEHLKYEYIEKNASDQRSKKAMLNLSSDTYSLGQMNSSSSSSSLSKYVLIMDEVDGVSGNDDRGGIQELITIIKQSRIPIICICNDRQHKKIRSLANYCYDLRFYRPTIQQIRAAMLTILHQENISNLKQELLDEIIQTCNQDIRQVIHSLNLWAIGSYKNNIKAIKYIDRTINNNPFELCRLSFSSEYKKKSFSDKMEIFFNDYQLMPLLIQENYLQCQPQLTTTARTLSDIEQLNLISKAADSISLGDVYSQMIFSKNDSWSLLPYQAVFSTVAPCSYIRGNLRGMVNFSSYFGQRSRTNKNQRLLNEIEKHVCLKILSANKQEFNLDYLPYLTRAILSPLKQISNDKNIQQCIKLLDDYYLNRDDLQTIMELNTWGKTGQNPYEKLDAQIKSSLTRNYNKLNHLTPYVTIDIKKLKKSKELLDDNDEENDEEEIITLEENNIEDDSMIKLTKKPPKKKVRQN